MTTSFEARSILVVLQATENAARRREFRRYVKLYAKYLPLYRHFSRRVLCFEPDPITFSDGVYGQIYTRPDGAYVVGVMSDWVSVGDRLRRSRVPYVQLRLQGAAKIGRVQVHYAGRAEPEDVLPKGAAGQLVVELPELTSAAVVLCLSGEELLGKTEGTEIEEKTETLGDPTVGYELGTGAAEKPSGES